MAIFFKSVPTYAATVSSLEEAFKLDPATIQNPKQLATKKAEEIYRAAKPKFSWGRLLVAVLLLAAIFYATVYTAQVDKLADLYKLMLHSFELILGAVLGLLTGEAISH
jgi:hypothetical protein